MLAIISVTFLTLLPLLSVSSLQCYRTVPKNSTEGLYCDDFMKDLRNGVINTTKSHHYLYCFRDLKEVHRECPKGIENCFTMTMSVVKGEKLEKKDCESPAHNCQFLKGEADMVLNKFVKRPECKLCKSDLCNKNKGVVFHSLGAMLSLLLFMVHLN